MITIVHYDNAMMTIKVCTLAAYSTWYDAFELFELLNQTYIVLTSVAQVSDCKFEVAAKDKNS